MQTAYNQFRENIQRVRNLGLIYSSMNAQTTAALDLSDILRAQLVLTVSSLDQFIHGIVRIGMLQAYLGQRVKTKAFLVFKCSFETIIETNQNPTSNLWIDNEIRTVHGWQSFVQPDKISSAIHLISDVQLWQELGTRMNQNPVDIKLRLNLIIERRNKISHEADIDPVYGTYWFIDETMINESICFIEDLVNNIYAVINDN